VIETLTYSINLVPDFYEAHEQRAIAYENLRRPSEAKADKDKAEVIKRKLAWEAQKEVERR